MFAFFSALHPFCCLVPTIIPPCPTCEYPSHPVASRPPRARSRPVRRSLSPGKVVILLNGRHAGTKAVIVQSHEKGSATRKYPFAVVAGISKAPRKMTRAIAKNKRKAVKRLSVKPFIKTVNFSHVMPTRYQFKVDFKDAITPESLSKASRGVTKRKIRTIFEEKSVSPSSFSSRALRSRFVSLFCSAIDPSRLLVFSLARRAGTRPTRTSGFSPTSDSKRPSALSPTSIPPKETPAHTEKDGARSHAS